MKKRWIVGLSIVAVIGAIGYLEGDSIARALFGGSRVNVLEADGSEHIVLIDASHPISLSPVPDGWRHRIFRSHPPMSISFVEKIKKSAIRLETNDSASILTRLVDVPLDTYRLLRWEWLVEVPIRSELDERTGAGDDHPARITLKFQAANGDTHHMEIVWGNKIAQEGEWFTLTELFVFHTAHYIARGGMENVGRWYAEAIDLRAILKHLGADPADARLTEIGLFADSDTTNGSSVAYFSSLTINAE